MAWCSAAFNDRDLKHGSCLHECSLSGSMYRRSGRSLLTAHIQSVLLNKLNVHIIPSDLEQALQFTYYKRCRDCNLMRQTEMQMQRVSLDNDYGAVKDILKT